MYASLLNPRSKRNAPIYSWAIGSRKLTKPALEALIPYLRVKRELAVLLLSFVDKSNTWIKRNGIYPAEVHSIYSRIKAINGRRYAHAI